MRTPSSIRQLQRGVKLLVLASLVGGPIACARRAEQQVVEPEPAITEGHGRVCVIGPASALYLSAQAEDATIARPNMTGTRTCHDIAPGVVWAVVQREDGERELIPTWVDAGETTTIELGAPFEPSASAVNTEALAKIIGAGRCTLPLDCSAAEHASALERLREPLRSASVRERQAARLLRWSLPGAEHHALAAEVWRELDQAPRVAASYPDAIAAIADVLGPERRRELEDMASNASGAAGQWSAYVRAQMLFSLVKSAKVGAEGDPTRARIRATVSSDPALRESMYGAQVLTEVSFDQRTIEQAEILARAVVKELAAAPCEADAHWLLYFHSPACPACKPATKRVGALLDGGNERLRVVTVAVHDDPSPFADRPEVEAVALTPALEDWFTHARGGPTTPYFMGLRCGDSAVLRLVGFGGLDDATTWDR